MQRIRRLIANAFGRDKVRYAVEPGLDVDTLRLRENSVARGDSELPPTVTAAAK